jgi:Dolichyl-phosphate-mannose-protein mannosyltransferase
VRDNPRINAAGFLDSNRAAAVLLALPLVWMVVANLPLALRDSIFPFDSALIAANGGLFAALFADLGSFAAAPVDWLWAYYDQYPALSVRRHPPLFGFVAGIVYSITGVSTVAAKVTVLMFGLIFATGVFATAKRYFGSFLLASVTTVLVVITQETAIHFYSVWLDIPSLSFAIWVFYFYLGRLQGDRSLRNILCMVGFAVLALYTYQPTILLLAGLFLHMVLREWRTLFTDGRMLGGAAALILLMLPLLAFTLYFAQDNLQVTTGQIPEEWQEFASPDYADWMIRDRLSAAYWLEYGRMLLKAYPVQLAGALLWLLLLAKRRPVSAETLMAACFAITYIGFSWLIVKGHRYTLYMMLPATFLTVSAIRDISAVWLTDKTRMVLITGGAVMTLAVGQAALVPAYVPYTYLSGMGKPIADIFAANSSPTILYSGRADAAFVLYARSADTDRQVSLHRASVQVTEPGEIASYIRNQDIDVIVLEVDNPGYDTLDVIDEFRDTILTYIASSNEFELASEYRLPYGVYTPEGEVLLRVYQQAPSR